MFKSILLKMPCKFEGCEVKYPSFNFDGIKVGIYCSKHKLDSMVNVRDTRCKADGCKKNPCFGFAGEKAIFCFKHQEGNMINLKNKHCVIEGCRKNPSYNFKGKKSAFCSKHKQEGMIDLKHKSCESENCITRACFNFETETVGVRCEKHKLDGMINIKDKDKICIDANCNKIAVFNFYGKKKGIFCSQHKKDGMINISKPKCAYEGCMVEPIFNFKGNKRGIRCSKHKEEGMIDLCHRRCAFPDCTVINPCFNIKGEIRGKFCKGHKEKNMVNITIKNFCEKEDCETYPSFDYEGGKGKRCKKHKSPLMINIKNRKCKHLECSFRPLYGYPHKSSQMCSRHKLENMIANPSKRCIKRDNFNNQCANLAIYGHTSQIVCEKHRTDSMFDFIQKKCTNCSFIDIISETTQKCKTCDEFFSRTVFKAKERDIKLFLDENDMKYVAYDQCIKLSDLKNRPDFLFQNPMEEFYVILEVDERQHKFYQENCECSRMVNLSQALLKPTVFIRYNPDLYKIDGNPGQFETCASQTERKNKLLFWLKLILNKDVEEIKTYGYLSFIQLFYDNYVENKIEFITITAWEH